MYVELLGTLIAWARQMYQLVARRATRPVMKLKSRATAAWSKDWFSTQLTWRHLSDIEDGDDETDYYWEYISSYDYLELSADIGDHVTVMVGAERFSIRIPPQWGWNSWRQIHSQVFMTFSEEPYTRD